MSFNVSKSSTKSSGYPGWVNKYFQNSIVPVANNLNDQFDATGGKLRTGAGEALNDGLSGKYLPADSNPGIAGELGNIRRRSDEALGRTMGGINSNEQINGTLDSTKTATNRALATRSAANDVNNQAASLLDQHYAQERGIQNNQIGQAENFSQLPFQQLTALLNLFSGGRSSGTGMGFGYNGTLGAPDQSPQYNSGTPSWLSGPSNNWPNPQTEQELNQAWPGN